jgi:hypothetical protein
MCKEAARACILPDGGGGGDSGQPQRCHVETNV